MTQQQRVWAALAQELSLVLSTHRGQPRTASVYSSRASDTLFWPLWASELTCTYHTQTHTCTHIYKLKINILQSLHATRSPKGLTSGSAERGSCACQGCHTVEVRNVVPKDVRRASPRVLPALLSSAFSLEGQISHCNCGTCNLSLTQNNTIPHLASTKHKWALYGLDSAHY